jgi:hypothetical protein
MPASSSPNVTPISGGASLSSRENRKFKRVKVALPARVWGGRCDLQKARTKDISEGGLFIASYLGPLLPIGQIVNVRLAGVISDQPDNTDYEMRVVHRTRQGLGLAFL